MTPRESTAGSTSTRVVAAVAAEKGVDSTALPPLNDAIDPDALDAIFEDIRDGERRRELRFSYAGQEIRVRNGGLDIGVRRGDPAMDD